MLKIFQIVRVTSKALEAKAAKLNMDSKSFDQCLTSGKCAQRVQQDQRNGYTLGVATSPVLFINGRYLVGAPTLSDLSKIIEEEICLHSLRTSRAASEMPRKGEATSAEAH